MDSRGVSAVLGYVMMIAILTFLVSGIFLSAGNFVEGQQERVIRSEFEVLGNRLAADIAAMDRLALAAGASGEGELVSVLPPRVAGQTYEISVSSMAGTNNVYQINLTTHDLNIDVEVRVRSKTPIVTDTVSGGDVRVTFNGTHIEVEHA